MQTPLLLAKKKHGFSLIELMIVIVIFAILASITYPSYLTYVQKSRRADGKTALLDAQSRLERCYTVTFDYNHDDCTSNFPITSSEGNYSIAITAETASYILVATPLGAQLKDASCHKLQVNEQGVHLAYDAEDELNNSCW